LFITSVTYRLPKKFIPNLKYKELRNYFADIPDSELNLLSAKSIFDAVCEIRTRKLPNTEQEPNAGSFFKNPVINSAQLDNLKSLIPEPIYFPMDGNLFKVPAAFLIEKAGWKGYSGEFAGISEKHALIIINKGNATGKDILKLAEMIIQSIFDKFLIVLEPEVIFW
jgi:UDP-N-acetylmuramate dehydrogenase